MVQQGPVEDIDPRVTEETWSQLIEQLVEAQVDPQEPTRMLKIGSDLPSVLKAEVEEL